MRRQVMEQDREDERDPRIPRHRPGPAARVPTLLLERRPRALCRGPGPDVALEGGRQHEFQIREVHIAVGTLADAVRQHTTANIVGWRLSKDARASDVAATHVEPVTSHMPLGYFCHLYPPDLISGPDILWSLS